jgi:hypothetical protein
MTWFQLAGIRDATSIALTRRDFPMHPNVGSNLREESVLEMTNSDDPAHIALAAPAAKGVQSGKLSVFQARELLGIQSR